MNNKKIFISGGAGVIGRALVDKLLMLKAQVFVGDLKICPNEWVGLLRYRQGDLNTITKEELQEFNPEIFFHLAATFERSEEKPSFFTENYHHNVQLSNHLLACLSESTSLQRVVFASSYLIYDPSLYLFDTPQGEVKPLSENDSCNPRNLCGAAKYYHERELSFFSQFWSNTSFVAARIFRVYGKNSNDIISRWIRSALNNESLKVYRPEGRFDYIFADDVAEGLLRLSQTSHTGIVNLGSGHSRSVSEVLNVIESKFPDLKATQEVSTISYEASVANMDLFKTVTGWVPQYSLEMVIPQLIEYEKQKINEPAIKSTSVLITSISKKIPFIDAVRKASEKLGHYGIIHGCDSSEMCIARYSVDSFWKCPTVQNLTKEIVIKYCYENNIGAIIPTRNGDLEFYSRHIVFFRANGLSVMISDEKAISLCLDKMLFASFLGKQGFPTIPTATKIEEVEAISYVVKDQFGAGSLHLGLNLSRQEALRISKNIKNPIFQPYISGQEWSIDVYRSVTGRVKGCVARLRDYVVDGESQVTTTKLYPELELFCGKLADALNVYGHVIFQVIVDRDQKFHVIECNPRFGGASTAALGVGLDSFYWFFLESLGVSLEGYPFVRKKGEVRQVRYAKDKLIEI